jgi:hypothetical protein
VVKSVPLGINIVEVLHCRYNLLRLVWGVGGGGAAVIKLADTVHNIQLNYSHCKLAGHTASTGQSSITFMHCAIEHDHFDYLGSDERE